MKQNEFDRQSRRKLHIHVHIEGTVSTDPIVFILPAEPNAK